MKTRKIGRESRESRTSPTGRMVGQEEVNKTRNSLDNDIGEVKSGEGYREKMK